MKFGTKGCYTKTYSTNKQLQVCKQQQKLRQETFVNNVSAYNFLMRNLVYWFNEPYVPNLIITSL